MGLLWLQGPANKEHVDIILVAGSDAEVVRVHLQGLDWGGAMPRIVIRWEW